MRRKEFIKTCGLACLGATSIGVFLHSCVSTKNISANIEGDELVIPKSDFTKKDGFYNYIVINNSKLQFPIALFRFSSEEYNALYLKCTHQGNELNAFGDKLVCSAHGSEFDNKGNVTNGPATDALRSFPVRITKDNLHISLKSA
ncbi:QcrA and Rieske domain-containing protein [Arenibacter latericius]|uniref:QcrA and Rieske domain-containing protein n=1 Tax=Arenibacter latericius TaxID=86104 RepID=UPI000406106F|nr:Rieske (2Fe-2S) protein [Arenibacter latericius]